MKNDCLKERKVDNPYEIWKSADGTWTWHVLKKWQVDDDEPFARWMCAVKSPFTYDEWEIGDVYVKEIKVNAIRVMAKITPGLTVVRERAALMVTPAFSKIAKGEESK